MKTLTHSLPLPALERLVIPAGILLYALSLLS